MNSDIVTLKYGNTNTFLLRGSSGSLLIDTDYAGTMPGFYRALKANKIRLSQIRFVMATHYHPDHCGLIGRLQRQGVRLLLLDSQLDAVHFPDDIFAREKQDYIPVDPDHAMMISADESRPFLERLGLEGEIIPTRSHSSDGIALILDDGNCFVGDLEPPEYIGGYADNSPLAEDWQRMMRMHPKIIHRAHAPEAVYSGPVRDDRQA